VGTYIACGNIPLLGSQPPAAVPPGQVPPFQLPAVLPRTGDAATASALPLVVAATALIALGVGLRRRAARVHRD
jgi:LPXTG-motif cell wall-anchored protein